LLESTPASDGRSLDRPALLESVPPSNALLLDPPASLESVPPSKVLSLDAPALPESAPSSNALSLDAPACLESPSAALHVETWSGAALVESAPAPAVVVPAAASAASPVPCATPPRPRGPGEHVHHERLRQSLTAPARRRRAQRRDPAWQQDQRQREQGVRTEVVALASAWQDQGVPLREVANLLGCPARTLRHWRQELAAKRLEAHPLGRPHLRCTSAESAAVIRFLHEHGPWVGLPTLAGEFVGLPTAELRDLLGVFRHLWIGRHPRLSSVLHWHQVGTVWAMDFSKVTRPIDGVYPYVFAVRDLASGLQLAWRPVLDLKAWTAQAELELLFLIHGAPLVLKSDNGSAFLAESMKSKLGQWQVWPLYSPPGQPGYNGAIAASIGSLKKRTQHAAYLAGHAGDWTTADLDRARELANQVARRRGAQGPTPQQLWESRQPVSLAEHESFSASVRHLEKQLRGQDGIAPDAQLDHYEQAALHRRVLQQVLMERGLLTITRRRLPQTFYGQKVDNIK